MLRLDRREPAEVERAVRWLFGPNLAADASFVVLSPAALRSKFDRIAVQMGRTNGGRAGRGARIPEGTWQREG
jgi:hypothetical protein